MFETLIIWSRFADNRTRPTHPGPFLLRLDEAIECSINENTWVESPRNYVHTIRSQIDGKSARVRSWFVKVFRILRGLFVFRNAKMCFRPSIGLRHSAGPKVVSAPTIDGPSSVSYSLDFFDFLCFQSQITEKRVGRLPVETNRSGPKPRRTAPTALQLQLPR